MVSLSHPTLEALETAIRDGWGMERIASVDSKQRNRNKTLSYAQLFVHVTLTA